MDTSHVGRQYFTEKPTDAPKPNFIKRVDWWSCLLGTITGGFGTASAYAWTQLSKNNREELDRSFAGNMWAVAGSLYLGTLTMCWFGALISGLKIRQGQTSVDLESPSPETLNQEKQKLEQLSRL